MDTINPSYVIISSASVIEEGYKIICLENA